MPHHEASEDTKILVKKRFYRSGAEYAEKESNTIVRLCALGVSAVNTLSGGLDLLFRIDLIDDQTGAQLGVEVG
jgi:hypothetical protein